MKQNLKKNLLHRFSCSLIVNGNKSLAYKVLLEAGRLLRQNCNTESSAMPETSVPLSLQILRDLARFMPSTKAKEGCQEQILLRANTSSCVNDARMREQIIKGERCDINDNLNFPFRIENLHDQSSEMRDAFGWQKLSKTLEKDLPVHNEKEKGRFINRTLHSKTATNRKEDALLFARAHRKQNFLETHNAFSLSTICVDCVDTVKPILETRKVRKGRVTYKVPKVTGPFRQEGKAISMLIENAIALKKKGVKQQKEKDTIDWSFSYPSIKNHALFDDRTVPYGKTGTKKGEPTHDSFNTRKRLPLTEQQGKTGYRGTSIPVYSFPRNTESESENSRRNILKNYKTPDFVASHSLFSPKRADNLSSSFTSDRAFAKKVTQSNDLLLQKTFTNQRFGVNSSLEKEKAKGEQTAFLNRKTLFTLFPFQSTKKLCFPGKTQNKHFTDSGLASYAQGFVTQNLFLSKRSSPYLLREVAPEGAGGFSGEKIASRKDKVLLFKRSKQSLDSTDIMTLEASNCKNPRRSRTLLESTHSTTLLNHDSFSTSSYPFDKEAPSTKQKPSITSKKGKMILTISKAAIKDSSLTVTQKATISYCLALCFLDCLNKRGDSLEKRKQLHKLALQNRAYTHFRWW